MTCSLAIRRFHGSYICDYKFVNGHRVLQMMKIDRAVCWCDKSTAVRRELNGTARVCWLDRLFNFKATHIHEAHLCKHMAWWTRSWSTCLVFRVFIVWNERQREKDTVKRKRGSLDWTRNVYFQPSCLFLYSFYWKRVASEGEGERERARDMNVHFIYMVDLTKTSDTPCTWNNATNQIAGSRQWGREGESRVMTDHVLFDDCLEKKPALFFFILAFPLFSFFPFQSCIECGARFIFFVFEHHDQFLWWNRNWRLWPWQGRQVLYLSLSMWWQVSNHRGKYFFPLYEYKYEYEYEYECKWMCICWPLSLYSTII